MLLVTAVLLSLAHFLQNKVKQGEIGYGSALLMGIAQVFATLPGISRSGATIATGLLLGRKKGDVAQFSFLMVLVPIIGANIIKLKDIDFEMTGSTLGAIPLLVGFLAAFLSGWLACSWMVNIVKKGKLIWFAIYCLIVGLTAISVGIFA